jgi:hypothetical protein
MVSERKTNPGKEIQMRGMKKFGISMAIAAGIGGALLSAPVANAAPVAKASPTVGADLAQGNGCYFNNNWYDICPSMNHDNDDRDRERRRNRDRRDDHHVEHHN